MVNKCCIWNTGKVTRVVAKITAAKNLKAYFKTTDKQEKKEKRGKKKKTQENVIFTHKTTTVLNLFLV